MTTSVTQVELDDGHTVELYQKIGVAYCGAQFDRLWQLHPEEHREVLMRGNLVPIPRWQDAFGRDYEFAGQTAEARPMNDLLEPALAWAREVVDPRMNGLLLNWYDGALGHYIGQHHDDSRSLVPGAPIVTMSFGEERIFRFTREKWFGRTRRVVARHDLSMPNQSAIVIPFETNRVWKHGLPMRRSYRGRRISITARAFQNAT